MCLYKFALRSNSTCKVPPDSEKSSRIMALLLDSFFFIFFILFYCEIRQEVLAREILAQIQTGPHDTYTRAYQKFDPGAELRPLQKKKTHRLHGGRRGSTAGQL